jgi:hypothetical protein
MFISLAVNGCSGQAPIQCIRHAAPFVSDCQSGVWSTQFSGLQYTFAGSFERMSSAYATQLFGQHALCFVSGFFEAGDDGVCRIFKNEDGWFLRYKGTGISTVVCDVTCVD